MPDKHSVRILWGQSPEPDDTPITYDFDTEAELNAFLQGVEEANGWLEYEIVDEDAANSEEDETDA